MKKVILLILAGIVSFVVGTAGIYLAMPTLAPAVVDSTRMRLDSLGLLPLTAEDSLKRAMKDSTLRSVPFDTINALGNADSSVAPGPVPLPMGPPGRIEISIEDSLIRTINLNNKLRSHNAAILAQVEELTKRIDGLESRREEAAELTKSLSKLEERQLGGILADLDLDVVEMLYLQASGRDRSRLLQNLPPHRAAEFVQTLVDVPITVKSGEAEQDTDVGTDTDLDSAENPDPDTGINANTGPSNQ